MSALLENAITWFDIANDLFDKFKKNTTENRFIRAACNHYQQAAEFALKGLLEALGHEYERGHDLEENATKLIEVIDNGHGEVWDALRLILDDIQWLSDKSGIIIKWEQKPRYNGENFFVKEDVVNQCKEHLASIIKTIDSINLCF